MFILGLKHCFLFVALFDSHFGIGIYKNSLSKLFGFALPIKTFSNLRQPISIYNGQIF